MNFLIFSNKRRNFSMQQKPNLICRKLLISIISIAGGLLSWKNGLMLKRLKYFCVSHDKKKYDFSSFVKGKRMWTKNKLKADRLIKKEIIKYIIVKILRSKKLFNFFSVFSAFEKLEKVSSWQLELWDRSS